ncbi:MAG: hypothetical protein KC656_00875 [Myxococcales bacterium]|nr:hypothetical protein [Myxococcales bacterium]MCB9672425.1 hypothetical protein [Alphaproteobacteria bacterium]MCB9693068.1 hypothetical protein [Alphaproteobacteria bacterium]
MKRIIIAGTACLAVLGILGCGGAGMGGGGGANNKAACLKWVEKHNSMPCLKVAQLDPESSCPDALDMSPTDMSKMYECQAENTKCNGDIPDLAGMMNCSAL